VFRAVRRALALTAAALIAGCGKPAPTTPDAGIALDTGVAYLSSAAYDVRAKSLLVGSYEDGAVQRISLAGKGAQIRIGALPQDGRTHVLRIRLDAQRQRIWVLDAAGLYAYEAASSRLIRRWPLDETQHSNEHCLPDIAVHASGTVFVSSAIRPKLWRIDGATLESTDHDIATDADTGKDFGFSALAFAGEDSTLYAASAMTGALWKVDAMQHTATKLNLPRPLYGACGLHAVRAAGQRATAAWSLYVAGGFRDGVMHVALSNDGLAGHVAAMKRGIRAVVPVDFVQTDRDLLLVSSHLSDHPEFNGSGRMSKGYNLVSLVSR
jgi:hypothetical protein